MSLTLCCLQWSADCASLCFVPVERALSPLTLNIVSDGRKQIRLNAGSIHQGTNCSEWWRYVISHTNRPVPYPKILEHKSEELAWNFAQLPTKRRRSREYKDMTTISLRALTTQDVLMASLAQLGKQSTGTCAEKTPGRPGTGPTGCSSHSARRTAVKYLPESAA
eukprot:5571559-Pleurochrysis_carterae.AAC.2